ncbi:hypothetical protein [Klebsiella pneumoniae]|uniref:hypothetical protein n=1 Tax=Klebsiella pneumoniae TaxID=573 RepID=UPI0021CC50A9|nr:hypothetical protein [Klebsiella pneumoniae]
MTKSTITRERLEQLANFKGAPVTRQEEQELARMALAAMDSEPVAWTDEQELRDVDRGGCGYLFTVNPVTPHADERRIILLYRHAQPAPVVPEDVRQALSQMDDEIIAELDAEESACRTAMLQDQPAPVVPDFQDVLESLDYEVLCNARESEHVLKACQATYDACRAAMLQSGNSPVIPDGYVMVPKEPTEEMNKAGWAAMNEHDAINPTYRAMLAAAPQEVKDGK